ncbi:ArgE/DapE family deacylase [Fructilactobacillus florum]|uniref:Probable succinyl-diaminopimelate desuccinylase n=1 Tax=Fructilactobacillus florum DSM 22689 = JCM 16035 TaxID=1423745 RepID=A0A0R2CL74_9LACO|nr:ArgE/DapE family deacylase [Fructilactobacillus florum]KRM92350.1 succinyl-diaminopimelate desuccinylase [Fructilactobacillus florum DSM 22689 = JCM 16035]
MKENEKIQILADLVAFDSCNGNERPVAEYLLQLFQNHGISAKLLPLAGTAGTTRANLVAEIGSGHPILAFDGHLDTVAFNRERWQTDPLKLTEQAGQLYGRGTTDMKSGVAAAVIAMLELHDQHLSFPGTIRFLGSAGEEVGMQGATELQQHGYTDDIDALIVGEPSGYATSYASKGEVNLQLTATGRAAHSSTPQFGINAVQELIKCWQDLADALQTATAGIKNHELGRPVFNLDQFNGGKQPNIIPGTAQAVLNIRTIPEFDNSQAIQLVTDTIKRNQSNYQAELQSQVTMNVIPVVGQADSPVIKQILTIAQQYTNQPVPVAGCPGGTDASRLLLTKSIGFPVAIFGPGDFRVAHRDNEFCSKQMYLNFTEIYPQLFVQTLQALVD